MMRSTHMQNDTAKQRLLATNDDVLHRNSNHSDSSIIVIVSSSPSEYDTSPNISSTPDADTLLAQLLLAADDVVDDVNTNNKANNINNNDDDDDDVRVLPVNHNPTSHIGAKSVMCNTKHTSRSTITSKKRQTTLDTFVNTRNAPTTTPLSFSTTVETPTLSSSSRAALIASVNLRNSSTVNKPFVPPKRIHPSDILTAAQRARDQLRSTGNVHVVTHSNVLAPPPPPPPLQQPSGTSLDTISRDITSRRANIAGALPNSLVFYYPPNNSDILRDTTNTAHHHRSKRERVSSEPDVRKRKRVSNQSGGNSNNRGLLRASSRSRVENNSTTSHATIPKTLSSSTSSSNTITPVHTDLIHCTEALMLATALVTDNDCRLRMLLSIQTMATPMQILIAARNFFAKVIYSNGTISNNSQSKSGIQRVFQKSFQSSIIIGRSIVQSRQRPRRQRRDGSYQWNTALRDLDDVLFSFSDADELTNAMGEQFFTNVMCYDRIPKILPLPSTDNRQIKLPPTSFGNMLKAASSIGLPPSHVALQQTSANSSSSRTKDMLNNNQDTYAILYPDRHNTPFTIKMKPRNMFGTKLLRKYVAQPSIDEINPTTNTGIDVDGWETLSPPVDIPCFQSPLGLISRSYGMQQYLNGSSSNNGNRSNNNGNRGNDSNEYRTPLLSI